MQALILTLSLLAVAPATTVLQEAPVATAPEEVQATPVQKKVSYSLLWGAFTRGDVKKVRPVQVKVSTLPVSKCKAPEHSVLGGAIQWEFSKKVAEPAPEAPAAE